ncbi:MAG: hypothetical protein ACLFQB_10180 [Chitinispirillaceae bacterium]
MDRKLWTGIEKLSRRTGFILVATGGCGGFPHLSVAQNLTFADDTILLEGWYCPEMLSGLEQNNRFSLTVWDPRTDEGYQIQAVMTKMSQNRILDGYQPADNEEAVPQVRWSVSARLEKISRFNHSPHSDRQL